jgi:hypothetical protein
MRIGLLIFIFALITMVLSKITKKSKAAPVKAKVKKVRKIKAVDACSRWKLQNACERHHCSWENDACVTSAAVKAKKAKAEVKK